MSLLFETIKLENGKLHLLNYHQKRLNDSRNELFGNIKPIDLQSHIEVPKKITNGLYRCRVSYAQEIEKIEFFPYQIRHPKSIKLIEANDLDYHLKFEDRNQLNELVLQSGADEIIITQNGYLTDTSYSNIALFDGSQWVTPSIFLLNGCKRQFLLDNQLLKEENIKIDDFAKFSKIAFINAMRDFEVVYNLDGSELFLR